MPELVQPSSLADRAQHYVTTDHYELCGWAEQFGVSNEEFTAAIRAVGDDAFSVEIYLCDRMRGGGSRSGWSGMPT